MRKKITGRIVLFAFSLLPIFTFGLNDNHLNELNLKFPYGLIGDDYGILNLRDLAINSCSVVPRPLNLTGDFYPYQYWQCFDSKKVTPHCNSNGTPDKYEGVKGLIVIRGLNNGIQNKYIERRFWPIKYCKRFIKDVAAILRGTKYACVSGSLLDHEKDIRGQVTTHWVFESIKTKKGCEGHDCEFDKEFNKENCPALHF